MSNLKFKIENEEEVVDLISKINEGKLNINKLDENKRKEVFRYCANYI